MNKDTRNARNAKDRLRADEDFRRAHGNAHGAPETFTAEQLRGKTFAPIRWAIPSVLASGVTLFGGREKMGKSWLALGACVAVATGGAALGKIRVEQGDALMLSLEDNERRLQGRINLLADTGTDLSRLHYAQTWPRGQAAADALDAWLTQHPETRLVVGDTLKKLRDPSSGRRNMYEEDYEAVEPFVAVAAAHNTALVLVHHLNQAQDHSDPYDAFSGSAGLTAAAEGILLLQRRRGSGDAYLTVDGKDIDERRELALSWSAEACSWSVIGDAENHRMSKARNDILRVVAAAGTPVKPTYVADALDKRAGTVKKTMWEMGQAGQLQAHGDGTYSAPVSPDPGSAGGEEKDSHTSQHPSSHNATASNNKCVGSGENSNRSNLSNRSNPSNLGNPASRLPDSAGGNPSGNPAEASNPHTYAENQRAVTEVAEVTHPRKEASNRASSPAEAVTETVTEPIGKRLQAFFDAPPEWAVRQARRVNVDPDARMPALRFAVAGHVLDGLDSKPEGGVKGYAEEIEPLITAWVEDAS